jgi:hypothetical protein
MAAAVLSLTQRPDFERQQFTAWLSAFPQVSKNVWSKPELDLAAFAELENSKQLLRALAVQLAQIPKPNPTVEQTRSQVLECLGQLL